LGCRATENNNNNSMLCRGYVYPVIQLIRKVLCLFTFMFAECI